MSLDKKALKIKISDEVVRTTDHIAELKVETQPISPDCAIGRISRMDAINNKSVNEASLRQMEAKLKQLEIALKKIDEPGFGQCVRCGKPIAEGRLMLMPESNRCVHCA